VKELTRRACLQAIHQSEGRVSRLSRQQVQIVIALFVSDSQVSVEVAFDGQMWTNTDE
jgi:hypothetical protein